MYKIKRFSMMSESDLKSLIDSASFKINYRSKLSPQALPKLGKEGILGFGGSSKGRDLGLYHSTVRSSYRLRSYLRTFDPAKFNKVVAEYQFQVNSGLNVLAKNYVEFRDQDTQEPCNFAVINTENDNPLILGSFHESWDQLLDIALQSIDYSCDFLTYKKKLDSGEIMTRLIMTLDDYSMLVHFLTMFGYLRKVYGGVAGKVGLYIYTETED